MIASKNAIQQQREAPAQESFRVFPDGHGHWCARKRDGMVAGTFFNRDAAIRFVRRESLDWPAPKPSSLRNEVSL